MGVNLMVLINYQKIKDYVKKSRYRDEFRGLKPGSRGFDAKWKAIAERNPKRFEADQHQYIEEAYYNPMKSKLKQHGVNIDKMGPGVKDMVWSTSVQYGPYSSVILKSIRGKDINHMTESQFIRQVQRYKKNTVDSYFKSSTSRYKKGIAKRAVEEEATLLKTNQNYN